MKTTAVQRPKPKQFDIRPYREVTDRLHERLPGRDIEDACTHLAIGILTRCEGFERVEKGPDFNGTPFDFFGFKNGRAHMIEFKGSLNSFHTPGETQKRRLLELQRRFESLDIALLQVKLKPARYRIFYNDQMQLLFDGAKAPLAPIEDWLRRRLR